MTLIKIPGIGIQEYLKGFENIHVAKFFEIDLKLLVQCALSSKMF